jgi:hypothetical protein
MGSHKFSNSAKSGYNKGTIRSDLRYLVVSKDVRRHRLISISYISHGRCHSSSQNSAKYRICVSGFSRELAVPPSKLVLLFNAAFCRRDQSLSHWRDPLRIGGADGIVNRLLKKTEEKPLNSRVYCHLLIFPMSLRNPSRFFGHPYNAPFWQQLATVENGLSEVASRRAIPHNPVSGSFSQLWVPGILSHQFRKF